MAARSPEAGGRGDEVAALRTASGAARPRLHGPGASSLLLDASGPETRDPGHSALQRARLLAEQGTLRTRRLPRRLPRPRPQRHGNSIHTHTQMVSGKFTFQMG